MKQYRIEESLHDSFLSFVRGFDKDIDSLNQALRFVLQNWENIQEDEEKQRLREEIAKLEGEILELKEKLAEKDTIIESLRNQDPKLLRERMKIDWEKEKFEKEEKIRELKLELDRYKAESKAAVEMFKALCRSGKLPETVCQVEVAEFIRRKLGLDKLEEGG
jgi:chromosome segregation ATPase